MNRVTMTFLVLAVTGGCVVVTPDPVTNDNANWPPRAATAPEQSWPPPPNQAAWSRPTAPTVAPVNSPTYANAPNVPNAPRAWASPPQSTAAAPRSINAGISNPAATAANSAAPNPAVPKPEATLVKASYNVDRELKDTDSGSQAKTNTVSARTSLEIPVRSTETKTSPINLGMLRLVNNKHITFHFQVKDLSSSGASNVEIWSTTDLRNWKKYDVVKRTPTSLTLDVKDEGLYGFTMIVRNKDDSAKEQAPPPGMPPQVWVAVDTTKPVVQLLGAELNVLTQSPALVIRWNAQDHNFGPRPITLMYAERPEGPWSPIAANVENSGHYEWTMPPYVPADVFVRVQAADMMGNLGMAQTTTLHIPGRRSVSMVHGDSALAEPPHLSSTLAPPDSEANLSTSAPAPAVFILSVDGE